MEKYPNTTLKIILRHCNKILILKHKNGTFDFPGGRIEWKESILEALKREIKEELHYLLMGEPKLFDIWNYISKNGKRHSVMIYFIHHLDKKPYFYTGKKITPFWLTKKDFFAMKIIKNKEFVHRIFDYKN